MTKGEFLSGDVMVISVLLAVGIAFFVFFLTRAIALHIRRYFKDRVDKSILNVIVKIVNYTVFLIAALAVLPMLGINLSGLIVAGGIIGLVIGFASQRIVSNLMSGVFLIIERPIKRGQHVQVEGVQGSVEDIHMFATVIRTEDGLSVRIPNEKVFSGNIANLDANIARQVSCDVGIGRAEDLGRAVEMIRMVTDEHPFVLKNPEARISGEFAGQNETVVNVKAWVPVTEWSEVRSGFPGLLRKSLDAGGIPVRRVGSCS